MLFSSYFEHKKMKDSDWEFEKENEDLENGNVPTDADGNPLIDENPKTSKGKNILKRMKEAAREKKEGTKRLFTELFGDEKRKKYGFFRTMTDGFGTIFNFLGIGLKGAFNVTK